MNSNSVFNLKENIRQSSSVKGYSVVRVQQSLSSLGDHNQDNSFQMDDDDNSEMSFGSESSSVLSSTSSSGSQHNCAFGSSLQVNASAQRVTGNANSLASANSTCSYSSTEANFSSAMDDTFDGDDEQCEDTFHCNSNAPSFAANSTVTKQTSFAMVSDSSSSICTTKHSLTIEPPAMDAFIPTISASSNASTGLSLCGPVSFQQQQIKCEDQQVSRQQLDEMCISPGPLCSPTTFSLKYETVRDFNVPDTLNFISPQTMSKMMQDKPKDLLVIDCRFPHEYEGGHIKGALNLYRPQEVKSLLFDPMRTKESVIVFHCEFSQKRGPKMYRFIRELDRQLHFHIYPLVNYVDMYVLKGGFKAFHESGEEARSFCEPNGYVPMSEKGYEAELKQSWRTMTDAWSDIKDQGCGLGGISSGSGGRSRRRNACRKTRSSASLF